MDNKPVSMLVEGLRTSLTEAINNSHLHISIVEMIMKEVYTEVVQFNNTNSAKERAEYENRLRQSTEEEISE